MDQETIKRERFAELAGRRILMIVETESGYRIERWSPDGVAPCSIYESAVAAAARILQLLKITEPVMPQCWPEVAQIGEGGGHPPLSS